MALVNYAASVVPAQRAAVASTGYHPGYAASTAYQPVEHTPIGNLAAFKGDLLYPLFTMGFFILGVMLVVKTIISILGIFKFKIAGSTLDAMDRRRKRSAVPDSNADMDELNALTNVLMAAIDSQECMQRMTCELGAFVRKYDNTQLITSLGEQLAPKHLATYYRIFKFGENCDRYRCGHLPHKK